MTAAMRMCCTLYCSCVLLISMGTRPELTHAPTQHTHTHVRSTHDCIHTHAQHACKRSTHAHTGHLLSACGLLTCITDQKGRPHVGNMVLLMQLHVPAQHVQRLAHQLQFNAAIPALVIGSNLDELSVSARFHCCRAGDRNGGVYCQDGALQRAAGSATPAGGSWGSSASRGKQG